MPALPVGSAVRRDAGSELRDNRFGPDMLATVGTGRAFVKPLTAPGRV